MTPLRENEPLSPVPLHVVSEPMVNRSSLPTLMTSFIGREADIDAACALLRDPSVRLVTMTGPGGVGKTSLAICVAHELEPEFPDGVWFVPLASVTDASQVPGAVAKALAIRESGHRAVEEGIAAFLRGQEALLVLDNFEHVLGAAPFVAELLAAAPQLTCLVTSRALLRISAEHDLPVPPLQLPMPDRSDQLAEVAGSPAVRLFVARARAVKSNFALSAENAAEVATICREVDGLPLAIELAASRIRHFSPASLLARLEGTHGGSPLNILVGGPLDAPDRQRSLRDTIAWSYDLLEPEEQSLFCALSVFVGGFSLDAAEMIAPAAAASWARGNQAPPLRPLTAMDGIASLVDKSLIEVHQTPDGDTRYSFVETIRDFGLEMLREAGLESAVREAHARYFLDLGEQAGQQLFGAHQYEWWNRLEIEHANLRVALLWLDAQPDDGLVRLANALLFFWWYQGHLAEGRFWLERALAKATDHAHPGRAWAAVGAALLTLNFGDMERMSTLVDEAQEAARASGDQAPDGMATMISAWVALLEQRNADAIAKCNEAVELLRAAGSDIWLANGLGDIGLIMSEAGERERGAAFIEEALTLDHRRGNRYFAAVRLSDLGLIAHQNGDERRAAAHYAEAARILSEVGGAWYLMSPLAGLAAISVRTDPRRCARLLGAADALRERSGQPGWPYERSRDEQAAADARNALGEEIYQAESRSGRTMPLTELLREVEAVLTDAMRPQAASTAPWAAVGLSPREAEVLALIVAGRTDREIADELYISPRTASKHVANILAKLEVDTRGEAAVRAVRLNLT